MALLLHIDTSTDVCSVALSEEGKLTAFKENREGMTHALLLGVFVDELLKEQGLRAEQLDAVSVSIGPGSYTGLRIGVSFVKGLCYAAHKPVITIGTLCSLADYVAQEKGDEVLYSPMIDARRMEVYTALYKKNGDMVEDVHAEIITPDSFREKLNQGKIYFFGDGSDKVKEVIQHPNAVFIPGIYTSAGNLIRLAEEKFQKREFADVAYFEPCYLKEFVATTPRHKII